MPIGGDAVSKDNLQDAPSWMKWAPTLISQVGFPIVACLVIGYIAYDGLGKNAAALMKNTEALIELKSISMEFQRNVSLDHKSFDSKLERICDRLQK